MRRQVARRLKNERNRRLRTMISFSLEATLDSVEKETWFPFTVAPPTLSRIYESSQMASAHCDHRPDDRHRAICAVREVHQIERDGFRLPHQSRHHSIA